MRNIWLLPASVAVTFLLLTAWTIVTTGQPAGFIFEHLHSRWGTQVGIDLFNALFAGVYFANVLSRHYRFRAWPYVALTLCTGSPGLLALAARVLYARNEAALQLQSPAALAVAPDADATPRGGDRKTGAMRTSDSMGSSAKKTRIARGACAR